MNGMMNQRVSAVQDLAYQSILIRTLTPKPGVMMCDNEVQMKEKLICYLQCVFQINNDQHQEYLRIAETAKSLSTKIYLNCKLKEMKRTGVESMDVKEYYVKWYLQSQPDLAQKGDIRKSIMISTPKKYEIENLIVDVHKKVDHASPSSHDVKKMVYRSLIKNKLIGQVIIPLNTIQASGLEMWYNLNSDKKHNTMVNIKVQFSTEEKSPYAIKEYRNLLKLILQFELKESKVARFWWSGQYSDPAKMALEQQSAGLSPSDILFAKYAIYCEVHAEYELSFSIFTILLQEIKAEIKLEDVASDELNAFWKATKLLLPSCFLVVQKYFGKDRSVIAKTLKEALNILALVNELKAADESALFSAEQYDLKLRTISAEDSKSWNFLNVLSDSIYTGVIRSFQTFCIEALAQAQSGEEKLKNLISIVQKVTEEIENFKQKHNEYFQKTFDYPLFGNLFKFYESELLNIIEPIVTSVSNEFKRIRIPNISPEGVHSDVEEDEYKESKILILKLYFNLKKLVEFRSDQSLKNEILKIDVYHKWFTNAITHQIDNILLDVICKMEKIFEKDDLIDIGSGGYSYSSSALDTCTIIQQFYAFWKELEFSDVEESYILILKIFEDISTCLRYYSDELIKRIAHLPNDLILVEKTCLVINNIEYLKTQLSPTTQNFSIKEIIKKMYRISTPRKVRECSEALERITVNTDEIKSTRIVEVTDTLADKMLLNSKNLLSKELTANNNSEPMTELLEYLDDSHRFLFGKLNEKNFNAVVDTLWPHIFDHMHDLILKKKQKSFSYFERLRNLFCSMVSIFTSRNRTAPKITYQDKIDLVDGLLRLHSYKTTELIHKYYLDRYKERQLEVESEDVGEIMVNCYFQDNELKLDVMNARKIIPLDYREENDCNPYVRVEVFGPDGNMGIKKQLTETCYNTRTPLFDKCLIKPITFTPEQMEQKDTLIILTLKESQMYGFRKFYMSEASILLGDIVTWHPGLDLDSCGITKLELRRAKYVDNKYLSVLEMRKNDKIAEQFIYKLKNITNRAINATNEQSGTDESLADIHMYRMSI